MITSYSPIKNPQQIAKCGLKHKTWYIKYARRNLRIAVYIISVHKLLFSSVRLVRELNPTVTNDCNGITNEQH